MAVAVIVLAVVAAVLAIALVVGARRMAAVRATLASTVDERDRARDETARLASELTTTAADLTAERERAAGLRASLSDLEARTERIEAQLAATTDERDRARAALEESAAQHAAVLAAAREERDAAEARAAEADERAARARDEHRAGIDAEAIWNLELSRAERTWRHSVAVSPDQPSPFVGAADPLRVAVEVEVAALREEVGVAMELDWSATVDDLARRVVVLRVVQELLSAVSRAEQAVVLTATGGADGPVELHLGTPEDHEPVGAVELAGVEHLVTVDSSDGVRIAIH